MRMPHVQACACDNPGDRAPCACLQGQVVNCYGKDKTMRTICYVVPAGFFCVDAEAIRQARSEVPQGEFHNMAR